MEKKLNSLSLQVVNLLKKNKLTLSTAESCTGGLIANYITNHSGASNIYTGGFVTYSNKAKIKLLNINANIIKKYGAVSKETVLEMSKKSLLITNSDISVAVSGIAGPNGGTLEKPVGLVHHSISRNNSTEHIKIIYKGDRQHVRQQTAITCFNMLIKELKKS